MTDITPERLARIKTNMIDDAFLSVARHDALDLIAALEAAQAENAKLRDALNSAYGFQEGGPTFQQGASVRKKRGSSWRGYVCGWYSTATTPEGYPVESAFEPGSVQVWPVAALELWDDSEATAALESKP